MADCRTITGTSEVPVEVWDVLLERQPVGVEYLPHDPRCNCISGQSGLVGGWLVAGLGGMFSIGGGAIAGVSLRRRLRARRLMRDGVATDAMVVEVQQTALRINDVHQLRVHFRYRDALGCIHEGRSGYPSPEEAHEVAAGDVEQVRYAKDRPNEVLWTGHPLAEREPPGLQLPPAGFVSVPGAPDIDQKLKEFNEWRALQPEYVSPDPRYEVRTAVPADFPRIYALVDAVWERSRPRAAYDWLYLENPTGIARATVVIERSSGELVSTTVGFPWPVACGDTRLRATFGGDTVAIQRLQRTGLARIRRGLGELHPWRKSNIGLGAPNAASRQKGVKLGDAPPLGPLPNATMVLDFQAYLRWRKLPSIAARIVGRAANDASALWSYRVLSGGSPLRAEVIARFSPEFDRLTEDCMRFPHYWCPHDSDFLNWRYIEHVLHEYEAIALLSSDDEAEAYAVFRIDGDYGFLMEFAAGSLSIAKTLLGAVLDRARAAGCNRIGFYATSSWRYWPLLRSAGFRSTPSQRYIDADCRDRDDVNQEANWQLLPGDSDVT